ncbi:hypothetical protein PUR34_00840 [Streptomyces sp. JV185]|uniref:hypothetical protein n=1 Tax=Streptomyces sp. JV185 TaxID=858638 RepID=UPI002E763441|nr:hypothetical protein [Streptomyces sp. JV185]MEE1766807.1 hypothetical protein [Streptomyces sp. JV185]
MSFEQWAQSWESVPITEATELYNIGEASNGLLDDLDDIFAENPECFFVHKGDVTVEGPLMMGNGPDEAVDTVYVIDGGLTVNGPMRFINIDVYTPLYVTGSVTARDLFCLMDCYLIIGGSLTVGELLMTELDAGMLFVRGATSAGAWLEWSDRGEVTFAHDLKARRLRASDGYYDEQAEAEDAAEFLLPRFLDGDEDVSDQLWEAALEGQPILTDPRS